MPTFADNESGASVRTKINAVITTVDTNSATWNAAISDGGTAASLTITSADINGGTIDGAVIGGNSAVAGSFTTLTASTSIAGTLATASQTNITAVGTIATGTWQGTAVADSYIASSSNWNTAHGWGNHASAGYLTTVAINGVSDITITSVADNEVLAYDNSSSTWVNQTAAEAGLATSAQGSNADTAHGWGNHASAGYLTTVAINGVSDVTITSAADNEVLAYDNSSSTWINQTAAEAGLATSAQGTKADDVKTSIANITDVTIASVADNEVLAYDNSSSVWINQTAAEAGLATSAQGTNADTAHGWGNHASAGYLTAITGQNLSSLNDVSSTSPTDNYVLTYDASSSTWGPEAAAAGGVAEADVVALAIALG